MSTRASSRRCAGDRSYPLFAHGSVIDWSAVSMMIAESGSASPSILAMPENVGETERRRRLNTWLASSSAAAEFARSERAGDVEEEFLFTGVDLGERVVSRNETPGPGGVDVAIGVGR